MSLLPFYKPNKFNTGHACSWDVQSTGDSAGIYLEVIKQVSWNESTKLGSFKDGKKVKIKFNAIEAGAFIDTIRNNRVTSLFHSTDAAKTGITFQPYIDKKKNEQVGFSLSIKQGSDSYLIGFFYPEAIVLESFLTFALERFHQAAYAEKKKRFEASKAAKS